MRYLKQPIVLIPLTLVAAYLLWKYAFKGGNTSQAKPATGTTTTTTNTNAEKPKVNSLTGPVVYN